MTALGGCLKEDGSRLNVCKFLHGVRALWPFPTREFHILGLIVGKFHVKGRRGAVPFSLKALSDRAFTLD